VTRLEWVTGANAALLTDFYEITMAASYYSLGKNQDATFDLFVRDLPPRRNFLVACGLADALAYLESFRFDRDAIAYLGSLDVFEPDFLRFLSEVRFTGEVRAVPEGEIVFPGEPLLSVTAPLIEAQLVETFLLNCITFQTMVASKAARVAIACRDRTFVDFSARRDHGADAALRAARAAFIGGASGTSNVLAGKVYGVPVNGTMAHSYIMAFEDEMEAFRSFCRDFPRSAVLLIDTFDVLEGARRAARVAHELAGDGVELRGVRIDSGDLVPLTRAVRAILDEADLSHVDIVLSGDLDEYRIAALLASGAPVDRFGVGTQLGTSADAPALGSVYKLVAEDGSPKMKLSTGKATEPGRKQIHRFCEGGCYDHDVMAAEDEPVDGGRPLLECVMAEGRRPADSPRLESIKARCTSALDRLPPPLRSLESAAEPYPVGRSPGLSALVVRMLEQQGRRRGEGELV
jgi:nicotinate phosphoribosyltransferase